MREVTEEFYKAAIQLAEYVGDDDGEKESLEEMKKEGLPITDHILYSASIVGGWKDQFEFDNQ